MGRPAIQGFFGALAGRRAKNGVFITTSSFTAEARVFTESVSDSIVLVDGLKLAHLMIEHGVGVRRRCTVQLVELDSDYVSESESAMPSRSAAPTVVASCYTPRSCLGRRVS